MEATYKTKDVTNKTGIPKHIVRKYSQLLEEHGYMISKTADARIYKLDDLKLLKSIHERAATLQEDISETIPIILKEKEAPPVPVIQDKQEIQPKEKEDGRNFEEFMLKLEMLAQLNEAIIHQNSTLITQNRLKDEKLDELMQQVYVKEGSQEKNASRVSRARRSNRCITKRKDGLINESYV